MTLHPRLSKAAVELVKSFEGLRRNAARLENGGWTIGYGHTLSAREGAQVTAEEAEALLLYDLDKVARAVDGLVTRALNTNQFAALTAFAFNIGVENFKTSRVLQLVNKGQPLRAAGEIERWRWTVLNGKNTPVEGLIRRRVAERALFLTPPEGFRPVSTPVLKAALDLGMKIGPPADLWTPLTGEVATVERYEAPGAATTAAVESVTARLQALFPDEGGEPPPAEPGSDVIAPPEAADEAPAEQSEPEPRAEAEAEPLAPIGEAPEPAFAPAPSYAPEPASQVPPVALVLPSAPEPEPEPEPEASEPEPAPSPAALVLQPEPVDAPEPWSAPEPEQPPPVDEEEVPPPPSLFEAGRYPVDLDDLPEGFGRRAVALDAEGAAIYAPHPQAPSTRLHAPVVALVGIGGAALFVGSLLAMVYGKATLTNLVIGLLGVICMAPAGLKVLLKLFGERGEGQDA